MDGLVIGDSTRTIGLATSRRGTLATIFDTHLPGVRGTSFRITASTLNRSTTPIIVARGRFVHHVGRVSHGNNGPVVDFCNRVPSSCSLILGASRPLIRRVLSTRGGRYTSHVTPVTGRVGTVSSHGTRLGGNRRGLGTSRVPTTRGRRVRGLSHSVTTTNRHHSTICTRFTLTRSGIGRLVSLTLLTGGVLGNGSLTSFIGHDISLLGWCS